MNSEPALITGTAAALVSAIVVLMRSLGVDVSSDTEKAILGVLAIVGPLAAGFITRQWVTPVSHAQDTIDKAYLAQPGSAPKPTL